MTPDRLREMMTTGSPGLTDHAISLALSTLKGTAKAARSRSPYAIPRIVTGLAPDRQEQIIRRAVELMHERGL